VRVHMTTPGGALDETFDAVLTAHAVDRVTLGATLAVAELDGKLELATVPPASAGPTQLGISGELTPYGTFGQIDAYCPDAQSREPASSEALAADVASCGTVAVWPIPGACATLSGIQGVFPLGDRDGTDELSLRSAVELFEAPPPLPIHWRDGSATELSIEANLDGAACISPAMQSGEDGLWYSLSVSAVTADGRLDGRYTAVASAYPSRATLTVGLDDVSGDESANLIGLTQTDFSRAERTNFSFTLGWDELTGYWGDLSAWGFASADQCDALPEPQRMVAPEGEQSGLQPPQGSASTDVEQTCYVELEGAIIGATAAVDEPTDPEP
jgi:hypothetical protein